MVAHTDHKCLSLDKVRTVFLFDMLIVGSILCSMESFGIPSVEEAHCARGRFELSMRCDAYQQFFYFFFFSIHYPAVTADADIPRPMHIHMTKTFPSWYSMGVNAYNSEVYDVCETGTISPPENEDAGYECPSSGVYNFHFSFKNPGSRRNLFAGWSGYSYGVNVHFKHETEGSDYATCHLNVQVKKSDQDSYLQNAEVVGASLGIAGLAMGLFLRRRRERVADDDSTYARDSSESNEKSTEMTTNFALVDDLA